MPQDDGATTPLNRGLDIVHVVSSATFAGVERYVVDVASSLAERGHRIRILGDASIFLPNVIDARIEVVSCGSPLRIAMQLGRKFSRVDVVHVHMTAAELGALASWPRNRVPVVATRHFAMRRGSSLPVRLLAPVIRARITRQLSTSRFVATCIGEPSTVLYSGVRSATALVPEGRVVLVAQRLEQEKRTVEALRAWARAGLDKVGWELWIAGEGRLRPELERHVNENGLAAVRFLGHRKDLVALRAASGLLLATTATEAFGFSVVEAMAAGLPVVAADGGAHRETVGACDASLLYPLDDLDACAAIMRRLAASTDERVAVGARLRAYQQQHFSLDSHIDALEAVYAEVAR